MASDATKSHIFQQLFSIKILTKIIILDTGYIYFWMNFFNFYTNSKKAVSSEVGRNAPYQICKKKMNSTGSLLLPISNNIENIITKEKDRKKYEIHFLYNEIHFLYKGNYTKDKIIRLLLVWVTQANQTQRLFEVICVGSCHIYI
jgi:hypothetical protein